MGLSPDIQSRHIQIGYQGQRTYTMCIKVTELSRLPLLKSGTLYRNTSSQLPRIAVLQASLENVFTATIFLVDLVAASVT